MTRKPKYNYDIKIVEDLENEGLSIRAIARECGWPECNLDQWIRRNYVCEVLQDRKVKYIKK